MSLFIFLLQLYLMTKELFHYEILHDGVQLCTQMCLSVHFCYSECLNVRTSKRVWGGKEMSLSILFVIVNNLSQVIYVFYMP